MKRGRRRMMVLVLVLYAFILISCTPNLEAPFDEAEEEATAHKPVRGGTLSFSLLTPDHLNPILDQPEGSFQLMKLLYQPLFSLDKDYQVKGVLAENWDIQDHGEKYVIQLRKDTLWHDGEAFTAEDVKFTIDALKNKDVKSPYKTYVNKVKSYHIVDDHTIEIIIHSNFKGNIEALTFPILPQHRFKNAKEVMSAHRWKPIGTGPYQLKSFQRDKELRLEINEDYWGELPYIENIQVKIKNKNIEILKSFESKDVDLFIPNNNDWNRFGEDAHLSIYPYTTQNYHFIGLNHNHEFFKDAKVRKAIQLAINREEMLREILLNNGEITDIPLSPESWLYDQEYKTMEYQPNEAQSLLKEAGWNESDNGVLYKQADNKKVEFAFELIIHKDSKTRSKEAQMVKDYLASVGIKMNILKYSTEEIAEAIEDNDFDGILTGWGLSYMPDLSFALHSNQIKKGQNFVAYKNKEVNDLLVRAAQYVDATERKEVYTLLQDKLYQEVPYISLYIESSGLIVNNRIKGPIAPVDFNIFHNIEEWYIEYE